MHTRLRSGWPVALGAAQVPGTPLVARAERSKTENSMQQLLTGLFIALIGGSIALYLYGMVKALIKAPGLFLSILVGVICFAFLLAGFVFASEALKRRFPSVYSRLRNGSRILTGAISLALGTLLVLLIAWALVSNFFGPPRCSPWLLRFDPDACSFSD